MSSFPISRGPLLVLSILIIAVFVLRAFLSLPSRNGSNIVYKTGRSAKIRMLTFNIWFDTEKMEERMTALGQIVEGLKPDILTFQEVTADNLALLQKQRWFSRYHLIPPDVAKEGRYFVVILSVFPVEKWHSYPLTNSPLNLKLIIAETESTVPKFVIATTHLEHSGNFAKLREEHLRESLKILSSFENVCVMGDMNIERQFDGEVILPRPWIDAWLALPGHTDSNGYTWDQSKNPFIRKYGESTLKDRLDRVFCKLSDFEVKEMKIVGDKTAKTDVLPSDHFGLFTVLEQSAKAGGDKHSKLSQTATEVYFKRPPGWENLIKQ
ncbi:5'-tyrosyl-DNA phosphodiesterase-like [Oculina patagonica]